MAEKTTRERILDAAEHLFADHGFDATSLRRITSAADVNLAAVNYHFGSKDILIQEVFARRLGPLNEKRLAALDRVEQAAGGAAVELSAIVEAFVGPALRMSRTPGGAVFMRLFGYTLGHRDEKFIRMFVARFRTVVERFSAALGRAVPDASPEEIFWRMLFMIGAMAHTMALSDKVPALSGGVCHDAGVESILRRLVPFLTAGLSASVPTGRATS